MLGGPVSALAFSSDDHDLIVASDERVVSSTLAAYRAYLRASPSTYVSENALFEKAVTQLPLP
ncbi:MAG: hypothetical protein ABI183_12955 [Polyangiaceae bacterium]